MRVSRRTVAWRRRWRALGRFWSTYRRDWRGMVGLVLMLGFIAVAVFGAFLVAPEQVSPTAATGRPFQPPSAGFPLGTDNFGRSVLGLVILGSRVSLFVGFAATVVATAVGAVVGLTAGYYRNWIGSLLNGITNWFLVVPWIALAVLMAAILGPSLWNITLVIAITSWATTARLVRAQTLSVKERPFVERARAIGAGDRHVILRHILPNVFPLIFANVVLTVALAILSETTLALLGLGDPNAVSWGRIIYEAFTAGSLTAGYWWWLIPPGLMIMLVVLAFTMSGMALDAVLNPRSRIR